MLRNVPQGSEIRGLLDVCADRHDIELVGTRAGSAWPSGPVHADVRTLPYTRIPRPVFPLDDVTDWR